jgi:hypothetical protein
MIESRWTRPPGQGQITECPGEPLAMPTLLQAQVAPSRRFQAASTPLPLAAPAYPSRIWIEGLGVEKFRCIIPQSYLLAHCTNLRLAYPPASQSDSIAFYPFLRFRPFSRTTPSGYRPFC